MKKNRIKWFNRKCEMLIPTWLYTTGLLYLLNGIFGIHFSVRQLSWKITAIIFLLNLANMIPHVIIKYIYHYCDAIVRSFLK